MSRDYTSDFLPRRLFDRRFGLFQTLEEAIDVFKIRDNMFGAGIAQRFGSRPAGDAYESQSEPRRRFDVPDAVAHRNDAIEHRAVMIPGTRNGRADDRFAVYSVFGEASWNAMIIDA